MEVQPKKPSTKGPADWFTGDVYIDSIAQPQPPSRLAVNAVHFTPGARTAWHAHSNGQTLYVTEGEGLIQSRGESVIPIHPGQVIRTPADEWHWHGATPDHFMTHLSITEGSAEWGEHVSDTDYRGGSASA
jgi:quercetin dioxygenase-like cupin family protein